MTPRKTTMKEKIKINRIAFVIDRSGSMQGVMPNAVRAFNSNLDAIKEQVKTTGQAATVSLIIFDDVVETLFSNRPIESCKHLEEDAIKPRGSTALFGATLDAVKDLQSLKVGSDEDVSYLINVITDGQENASQPSSAKAAASLTQTMKKVQSGDNWTMTFLVPRGGKSTLIGQFSIPEGNVMEWSQTAQGVKQYSAANSDGIRRFFTARAAGQRSVKSFYTDMTHVSVSEVKALNNLTRSAKVLTVDRGGPKKNGAWEIQQFIEAQGLKFVKGAAFYELVGKKDNADKVQDYKKVLIMEKGKPSIYGGEDARRLLGLPEDGTTPVRPGDNGKFDIFIQSTSTNRTVKPGTKVIYMPSAAVN